jgi:hypothetical protein
VAVGSGGWELEQVTQEHCDRYLQQRQGDGLNSSAVMAEVSAIKDLARYGELFTADRYRPGFVPWESASAKTVSGFWLPKTSYGQVMGVLPICSKASRSPRIASRVPALRVPFNAARVRQGVWGPTQVNRNDMNTGST